MIINTLLVEASKGCQASCDVVGSVHGLWQHHSGLLGGNAASDHRVVEVQALVENFRVERADGARLRSAQRNDLVDANVATPLLHTALRTATPHFRHIELRLIIHITT